MSSNLTIVLVLLGTIWSLIYLCSVRKLKHSVSKRKQPPGPRALPVIGNLHMLGSLPHKSLWNLAKKYGPIMSMRLGCVPTFVVSSPEAAELFLKTHDTIFANRPKIQVAEHISYGTKGIVFTPYGSYWRHVRKLCTLKLLSPSRVELFKPIRREEVGVMVESLKKASQDRRVVDVSQMVADAAANIAFRIIIGRRSDSNNNLKEIAHEALRLAGAFNLADFIPLLNIIDLQGYIGISKAISTSIDMALENIIEEHKTMAALKNTDKKAFLDILLSMINQPMNPHEQTVYIIKRENIKAILLDLIVGAFETSSSVIDWTFCEIVKNPRVMARLQDELETIVGLNRKVEEADLPKLSYLDMVLKESLRLHPIAPLLLHGSREDVTIDGFYFPKKSFVMVNVYAIGRNPDVWSENADEFLPERFIGSNIDLKGHDFQLTPFGSGRRSCPGMHLALVTVRLVLAQLLHCFNWELPKGIAPSDISMVERFGLTVPRANHLLAVPTNRLLI